MNSEKNSLSGFDRDRDGRIIHPVSDELWLDPRILRTGRTETHVFSLKISPEELGPVPGVQGLADDVVQVTCTFKVLDDCIVCTMRVDSRIAIIDEALFRTVYIDCTDTADLSLSKDPEMADVLPGERGRYDLKPTALALFYSSIPFRYSSNPQETIEGDGFEVISEDEYARRKARGDYDDNPFKAALGDENSEK